MICTECQNPLTPDEERRAWARRGLCWPCFKVADDVALGIANDPLATQDAGTFSLAQAARYLNPWTTRRDRKGH